MKHEHPHHTPQHEQPQTVSGVYRQPIYSPSGELEGLLLEVDSTAAQIVIDPREHTAIFEDLRLGQMLKVEVTPAKPSPKGEAAHPVHRFHSLVAVDGKRPRPAGSIQRVFKGRVERLNYAKHGEPNGVVLDSGDFIHLRPQGFRDAALRVGDTIQAEGDARPMVSGGFVVEARQVNDVSIEPKKPKPPKHHGGPKHGPKHGDRHEGKAHPAH